MRKSAKQSKCALYDFLRDSPGGDVPVAQCGRKLRRSVTEISSAPVMDNLNSGKEQPVHCQPCCDRRNLGKLELLCGIAGSSVRKATA